jgi:hypothetical protein
MQRDHAHLPTTEDLRKLASWYRKFAERTGSGVIGQARLRMAEDLEIEADRLGAASQGE